MSGQANTPKNKYARLSTLSTEALNALLRADVESEAEENDEMVCYILELLEQREMEKADNDLSDVDEAWERFQTLYNTPEGKGLELYPTQEPTPPRKKVRPTRVFRMLAAALMALLLGVAAAQASGLNVFGAIGRWTEETFHFSAPKAGITEELSRKIAAAFEECGIPLELMPGWVPEDLEGEVSSSSSITSSKVSCDFFGKSGSWCKLVYSCYDSAPVLERTTLEKDDTLVQDYTSKGRTFYILSNVDNLTATWSDGQSLVISINGNISTDEIISIINSIGG